MANHIYPSLRYRDATAAVEFLEEAFGFDLVQVHKNEDGSIGHAEMRHGDAMIMFGTEDNEGIERFGEHAGNGWVYMTIEDPDSHYAQAVDAGADIVMELTDQDYGSRDYAARDLEGNLWSFGTYDPLDE